MIDVQTINTTINILGAIIGSTGFSAIVVKVFQYLKQIDVDKKIQNIDTLVKKAITFASQKGLNLSLDNDKMYNVALTWVKNEASKNGIKYSDDEWEGFIESTYKMLKNDWALANKNSGLNHSNISSNIIPPSTELTSLEGQNLANNEVVESSESIATVELQSDIVNIQETQKLALPEDMLSPLYASILEKSNEKAKLAVEQVITDITKSIAVEGEK